MNKILDIQYGGQIILSPKSMGSEFIVYPLQRYTLKVDYCETAVSLIPSEHPLAQNNSFL